MYDLVGAWVRRRGRRACGSEKSLVSRFCNLFSKGLRHEVKRRKAPILFLDLHTMNYCFVRSVITISFSGSRMKM